MKKIKKWAEQTWEERERTLEAFQGEWEVLTKALNAVVRRLEQIDWVELRNLHKFCVEAKGTLVRRYVEPGEEPWERPSRAIEPDPKVVKDPFHGGRVTKQKQDIGDD